jgi:hypothetical protein
VKRTDPRTCRFRWSGNRRARLQEGNAANDRKAVVCESPVLADSVEKLYLDDATEDPSLMGPSPFPLHGEVRATQEILPKSRYRTRRGTLDLSLLVAQRWR